MKRANHKSERGFTLVEIAIAITVVGLLITPLFSIYDTYIKEKRLNDTRVTLQKVVSAMETYRNIQGAYPCPAPMDATRNSPNNGRAMNNNVCDAATFTALTQSPGECLNGICLQDSLRAGLTDQVIIGTLPFRDLQITEEDALDGYGNRLLYAVTQDLTEITTFNSERGGIRIVDTAGNSLTPDDNIMFLLLSYGPSKEGAFNKNGIKMSPCPTGGAAEQNNCIDDYASSTISANASFTYAPITSASGTNEFDHLIQFHTTNQQSLWRRYTGDQEDAQDLSPSDLIGIGTDNPQTELDIHTEAVGSENIASVRIDSGALVSERICDELGNYCFDPKIFAGDATLVPSDADYAEKFGGIRCENDGEYLVAIENGQPVCEPFKFECDVSTPVFKGFDASNKPICESLPGVKCGALNINVCSPPVGAGEEFKISIPSGLQDGQDTGISTYGSCAKAGYVCDAGTWKPMTGTNISASRCHFTPVVTVEEDLDCGNDAMYGDQTFDRTTTTLCEGGTATSSTACICGQDENGDALDSLFEYRTCKSLRPNSDVIATPDYFYDEDGDPHEVRRERKYSGTLNGGGSCPLTTVSDWDYKNCTCPASEKAEATTTLGAADSSKWPGDTRLAKWKKEGSCGSGKTGDVYRLYWYDESLTNCKWKAINHYDKSACTCTETDGATREIIVSGPNNGCGAGNWAAGSNKKQPQIYDGATCSWKNNGAVINNCTCDTTPIVGSQPHACSDTVCQKPDPSKPDITLVPINPTTCQPDTASATITTPGDCEPRTFNWFQIGTLAGHASPQSEPNIIGKGCNCTEKGATMGCFKDGDATWKRYNCECRLDD